MRFVENIIETEFNTEINGFDVCLQKNIDGFYILSSNTLLIKVWYLLPRYNGISFVDVYNSKNDENNLPIFELDYCGEILQELNIDDDEETLKYNLEIIVDYIRDYLEN